MLQHVLDLFWASLDVTLLGFALGIVYTISFSTPRSSTNSIVDKIRRSFVAHAFAVPGLVLFVVLIPGVALGGMLRILEFVRLFVTNDANALSLAGFLIELCIVAGWMFEYALQYRFRNLPRFNFNL